VSRDGRTTWESRELDLQLWALLQDEICRHRRTSVSFRAYR
jgi:hypothetical protein